MPRHPSLAGGEWADSARLPGLAPASCEGLHPGSVCSMSAPVFTTCTLRWAAAVALIVDAADDPGSIDGWTTLVRVGKSSIKNYCKSAGAPAGDSLGFGRLVQAVHLGSPRNWRPEDVMQVMDERTLTSLLRRGGILAHRHADRPPLVSLFRSHSFSIPGEALGVLWRYLATRGLAEATEHPLDLR